MKNPLLLAGLIVLGMTPHAGCQTMTPHTDRGAILGGLAGAGIGAIIGENNDNPLAGAGIGAVVGALSGAALGSTVDADVARQESLIRQQQYLAQQQQYQRVANATTLQDVATMARSGVSDEVIISHIRAYGLAQRPRAADLIALQQQGVSERVLNVMLEPTPAPPPAQYVTPAPVISRPVVVHEYHAVPAPYYYHRYHHHHHCYPPRPRTGVSWHFHVR